MRTTRHGGTAIRATRGRRRSASPTSRCASGATISSSTPASTPSLVLGALPEATCFPGHHAELMFAPLEALPFPVDACLCVRWIANGSALALVRRRIVDADHAFSEESQGDHGPTAQTSLRPELARELEEELTGSRSPAAAARATVARGRCAISRRARRPRPSDPARVRADQRLPAEGRPARSVAPAPAGASGAAASLRRRVPARAGRRDGPNGHALRRCAYGALDRDHRLGRATAGLLRRHRGLANVSSAGDPLHRDARIGQDPDGGAARAACLRRRVTRRRPRPEGRSRAAKRDRRRPRRTRRADCRPARTAGCSIRCGSRPTTSASSSRIRS